MIEDVPKGQQGALDWTPEAALEKASEAATKEGYRQMVILMTKPGAADVRLFTVGLQCSERHRLISIGLQDALAGDLGLLRYEGTED